MLLIIHLHTKSNNKSAVHNEWESTVEDKLQWSFQVVFPDPIHTCAHLSNVRMECHCIAPSPTPSEESTQYCHPHIGSQCIHSSPNHKHETREKQQEGVWLLVSQLPGKRNGDYLSNATCHYHPGIHQLRSFQARPELCGLLNGVKLIVKFACLVRSFSQEVLMAMCSLLWDECQCTLATCVKSKFILVMTI